jgi:hypothetical protein
VDEGDEGAAGEVMIDWSHHDPRFHKLLDFLARVPSMDLNDSPSHGIGSGIGENIWWVKFTLAIDHPLAWNVVQELGHVLNYVSLDVQLPTVFKPVSPPPYLNGEPREFLAWVVECPRGRMEPDDVAEWLEGRLPRPVDDEGEWRDSDDDDE